MGKIMIIDEKMNSVVIEASELTLKMLRIKKEDVKNHRSMRQLQIELKSFIESLHSN